VARRTHTTITEFSSKREAKQPSFPLTAVADTHRENAEDRVRHAGPGVELIRSVCVARLRGYIEPFYEHGSLADMVALCLAFEEWEKQDPAAFRSMRDRATLLEAVLKIFNSETCD
jgi:hypothetical protein